MTTVEGELQARKAGTSQPTVPAVCQLPGHANSPACVAALTAVGVSVSNLLESCGLRNWTSCVRNAIATSGAIWAWDNGIDQHGHARGYEIGNGNGGERQDEGLRVIWPGDEGYDPSPPRAGQDEFMCRSWYGC